MSLNGRLDSESPWAGTVAIVVIVGDFVTCRYLQMPGISYDGGYVDYMIAPTGALPSIPDELSATESCTIDVCRNYNIQRSSE